LFINFIADSGKFAKNSAGVHECTYVLLLFLGKLFF